jgi:hypothetical protein
MLMVIGGVSILRLRRFVHHPQHFLAASAQEAPGEHSGERKGENVQ